MLEKNTIHTIEGHTWDTYFIYMGSVYDIIMKIKLGGN